MLRGIGVAVAAAVMLQASYALAQESGAEPARREQARAGASPVAPLFTNFTYFNHHWIQWLPDHPTYEAIEAQVYDGAGEARFIRVFLTERAPPKRQTYFFNDAGTAQRWTAGRAFTKEIALESTPNAGGARNLIVRLTDAAGAPLEWAMEFDASDRLQAWGAGLRPSQGHAADTAYILNYYGESAVARRAKLTIGGASYEYERADADLARRGRKTGYTAGSYTPVIRLGDFSCTADGQALRCDQGRVFSPESDSGGVLRSNAFGWRSLSRIELAVSGGALSSYVHRFGDHQFRFDFTPALPPFAVLRGGERFTYAVSLDDASRVVVGEMVAAREGDAVTFVWTPTQPAWMAPHSLTSRMVATGNGYSLTLRAGPGS